MPTPAWADGLSLRRPSDRHLEAYVETLGLRPLTYSTPGMSLHRQGHPPGYRRTELVVPVDDWSKAVTAVRAWSMHEQSWTVIRPANAPIEPGRDVATVARAASLWWLAPARVVALVDERDRWGFAYGTLEGHILVGEELFILERAGHDAHFRIVVLSRPADLVATAAIPAIRRFQRRFVVGALRAVQQAST